MSEVGEHGSSDTYKSGPCASAGYNPTVSKLHELHESKEQEKTKNTKEPGTPTCLGPTVSQTLIDFVFPVGDRDRALSEVFSSAAHGVKQYRPNLATSNRLLWVWKTGPRWGLVSADSVGTPTGTLLMTIGLHGI